jgi:hypothetical protein
MSGPSIFTLNQIVAATKNYPIPFYVSCKSIELNLGGYQ